MNNDNKYSKNYSKTTWSFWNYYRGEPNSGVDGPNNNINYSIKDSKCFNYKTSITGELEGNNAFLGMLLGTLGVSLLGNMLAGKGTVRARSGKGIVRAGSGKEMDF